MGVNLYYLIPGVVLASLAYFLYRLYPVPSPGIPYNPVSAGRMLGDAVDVKKGVDEPSSAFFSIPQRLGSPIAQMLITSFTPKPVILIDDIREAEDILIRRNREFDRSKLTTVFFDTLLPKSTLAQFTTPELKAQKRLWSDVMSTDFLRRVVAPNIRESALELVELWRLRTAQKEGEPFEVMQGFNHGALDAIWIALLGSKLGIVRRDIESLQGEEREKSPAEMQAAATSVIVQQAVESLNDTVEKGLAAIWPGITIRWLQSGPSFRRLKRSAEAELQRLMVAACERFERITTRDGDTDGEEMDTCAMDLVLRRETIAARKAGRPTPDPTKDPAMLQELLLLLVAVRALPSPTYRQFFANSRYRGLTRQPTRSPGSLRWLLSTKLHRLLSVAIFSMHSRVPSRPRPPIFSTPIYLTWMGTSRRWCD